MGDAALNELMEPPWFGGIMVNRELVVDSWQIIANQLLRTVSNGD